MPEIRLERRPGSVAVVTICRSETKNAFDDALIEEFAVAMEKVAADAPRALVLTGEGETFCAGYDVRSIDPAQSRDRELPDTRFERIIDALGALGVPVVAAVNGDAFGGGMDLALSCDVRVAIPTARFAMTPCRLGLVYSPRGVGRLLAALGPALARRMFFTASPVTARELAALGIVQVIESREQLLPAAISVAENIAQNAPLAVRGTREAIRAIEDGFVENLADDLLERLTASRRAAFASRDLKEGLAAFAAKRAPVFSGE